MTKSFRAYESQALASTFLTISQIEARIENLVKSNEHITSVSQLPASVIETEKLYQIALCYSVMYNLLLSEHLIKDGHIKPSSTLH